MAQFIKPSRLFDPKSKSMNDFKLPDMTPEQQQRAELVFMLRMLIAPVRHDLIQLQRLITRNQVIWLHFTDWYGNFDLPKLLEEGLIVHDDRFVYMPNGTWKDRFQPTAYRITYKGTSVLEHTGLFVWEGQTK